MSGSLEVGTLYFDVMGVWECSYSYVAISLPFLLCFVCEELEY